MVHVLQIVKLFTDAMTNEKPLLGLIAVNDVWDETCSCMDKSNLRVFGGKKYTLCTVENWWYHLVLLSINRQSWGQLPDQDSLMIACMVDHGIEGAASLRLEACLLESCCWCMLPSYLGCSQPSDQTRLHCCDSRNLLKSFLMLLCPAKQDLSGMGNWAMSRRSVDLELLQIMQLSLIPRKHFIKTLRWCFCQEQHIAEALNEHSNHVSQQVVKIWEWRTSLPTLKVWSRTSRRATRLDMLSFKTWKPAALKPPGVSAKRANNLGISFTFLSIVCRE